MLAFLGRAVARARSPTHRRARGLQGLLVSVALIIGSVTVAPVETASAGNNAGWNGSVANCTLNQQSGVNGTDPNPLTFFHSALESGTYAAVEWARTQRYEPTGISTSLLGSSNSLTDVVSFDQDYTVYCGYNWHTPGGMGDMTIAASTCVGLASSGACERHENRYDLSYMNAVPQNYREIVACHETGHAWGLTHRTEENGCMNHPMPHAGELTVHDTKHINGGPWIMPNDIYGFRNINNGEQMVSYDGRYRAVMQSDGNFVVYGPPGGYCDGGGVCWHTGTNGYGSGTWAVMQGDGNFVLYHSSAYGVTTLCNTGTFYGSSSTLELQTDGNLVVYSFPGHIARRASEWTGGLCT